jgi:hypothetical protein
MPQSLDAAWLCSALTIRWYFFDGPKKKQNKMHRIYAKCLAYLSLRTMPLLAWVKSLLSEDRTGSEFC